MEDQLVFRSFTRMSLLLVQMNFLVNVEMSQRQEPPNPDNSNQSKVEHLWHHRERLEIHPINIVKSTNVVRVG